MLTEVSVKNGYKATYNHYCKLIYPLFLILLVLLLTSPVQAKYSGGTGEPNDPYRIADANDMNEIGTHHEDWDAYFVLVDDINLAQFTGTQFNIIGVPYTPHFTGVFDGNDYTISNFTYTSPDANFIGLFACVGNNGKIKQLVMQNVNASGNWFTAGLVGMNFGKICDCDITGTISGNNSTGGLAGGNYGEISDCSVTAQVQGVDETGGLVGDNHGTIWDCYANSNVDGNSVTGGLVGENCGLSSDGLISWSYATGEVSGDNYGTGGLVGTNSYGTVSYCYATGNIDANNGAGGLVGWNIRSTISNCYSTASVLGDNHIGGLVGDNGRSTISNCYSAGVVDGNNDAGGLIGDDHDGTITNCFWDTESSGQSSSDGSEVGKTTAEMMTKSTFANADWDFDTPVWTIDEGVDYPRLWWETPDEPVNLIAELSESIDTMSLQKGITNSLQVKLDTTLQLLEDENEHNDVAAINSLQAFINAVEAQRGNKILEADADALIAAAQEIIDLLSVE